MFEYIVLYKKNALYLIYCYFYYIQDSPYRFHAYGKCVKENASFVTS